MLKLDTKWTRRNEVAKERLAICEECPELDTFLYQCKVCMCFMKGKTLFFDSKCPLNKWDKHIEVKDG